MSGIEVAGLVLGGFPILLNCLDYYRKGFEPLEEWWNFRTRFIEFIDNIRHQEMRYNENMYRLLDPIIPDVESLTRMINLPSSDPRWKSGSIQVALEKRLADEKPWQWHLERMRLSFLKNKHNKIEKLAKYNQQLQEILGYSERVLQISDRKKSSEPVTNLEKIRQHACHLHSALRRIWKCPESRHHHDAHLSLRADMTSIKLQVYFAISHDPNEATSTMQEVLVHPVETDLPPLSSNIGYSQPSRMLATIQQTAIQQQETLEEKSGFLDLISSRFKPKRPSSTVAPWKAEPQIPVKKTTKKPSEEEVRASLFTIGVMILELIFGYNIEDCAFRRDYFGRDDRPTDQTDICTAKKWAKELRLKRDKGLACQDLGLSSQRKLMATTRAERLLEKLGSLMVTLSKEVEQAVRAECENSEIAGERYLEDFAKAGFAGTPPLKEWQELAE
ncbi:hypothetical protein DL770_011551 [Monosporascus sp. CRB-9-2]|nr:hypothetical protein DL770_011551 [Monosporascus sp. CRB-9-2]